MAESLWSALARMGPRGHMQIFLQATERIGVLLRLMAIAIVVVV